MRAFLFLLLSLLVFARGSAQTSLESSRYAQSLLGPTTWSRILRIENTNSRSVYPKTFYALIFEFAGILWFYTETDGTQSFSLYENRLDQEKTEFTRELIDIDPGLTSYSVIGDNSSIVPRRHRALPNGCFIESLVAARDQISHDRTVSEIRLVMFYAKERREGHCVVAYRTPRGVYTLDPADGGRLRLIGGDWPKGDLALAAAAWPAGKHGRISAARTLGFPLSAPQAEPMMARAVPGSESAPGNHG